MDEEKTLIVTSDLVGILRYKYRQSLQRTNLHCPRTSLATAQIKNWSEIIAHYSQIWKRRYWKRPGYTVHVDTAGGCIFSRNTDRIWDCFLNNASSQTSTIRIKYGKRCIK